MSGRKTIAFFPEACYGPALNSVGIAQACVKRGHTPIFLTDPGMSGVYEKYGFETRLRDKPGMVRMWGRPAKEKSNSSSNGGA